MAQDIFGMCQALIADPELVTKTINNNEKDIYNCLAHEKLELVIVVGI